MFEVGKAYRFILVETSMDGTHETDQWFEVAAIEGNLLKLLGPDFSNNEFLRPEQRTDKREELILNTASMFFHGARPADK